ncbi:MAG TPA: MFS transporter [Bryobacteraceae bacterium]|nr:MFS transporter [Bryobacteraceae bacterium]
MMSSPAATRTPLSRAQWIALLLLVFSVFINYVDRGNLSVAAPPLKTELDLSPEQLGLLLSGFFWTYAAFQLFGLAGWLVDRFDAGLVYAIGYLLWSGATAATGLVRGFVALFALRLILGMGESVAYPAYSKLLSGHFPEHHRGLANALIDMGSKLGPALGTLMGGVLIARFGWRPFFIVLGLVSLAWLAPWMRWMPRGQGAAATHPHGGPSIGQILRHRSAWGTFGGLFCGNYVWYFLLTWLPSYMVMERHFSMDKMAAFGSIAYLAIGLSAAFNGWLSDRWIAAGGTPTRVRKTFTSLGLSLATIILPVAMVKSESLAMWLLMAGCVGFGLFSSNHWAITQTLSGPVAAGRWTSLQNGVGNLAGVTAPWLTGLVVARTGSFLLAFGVAAAVSLAGACFYLFVIGPVREVRWDE